MPDGIDGVSDLTKPFYIGPIGDRGASGGTPERDRYEQAILALEHIVKRACEEAGLDEPLRSDMISQSGEIPEQVFRHLRDDQIVIADLTDGNPNVMYELGLRHTKDKLTILIVERGRRPFNVSVMRSIEFTHTEGGYIDAKNEVRRQLEEGLQGSYQPVTATRVWNEEDGGRPSAELTPTDEGGAPAAATPPGATPTAPAAESTRSDEEEPLGWLEVWAQAEESFPKLIEAMNDIGSVMNDFTSVSKQGQDDLETNERRKGGTKGKLIVAIQFAERLDPLLDRLDEIAARYLAEVTSIEPAVEMLLDRARRRDFDLDDEEEVADLCSALQAMAELSPVMDSFITSASQARGQMAPLKGIARPVAVRIKRLESGLDLIVSTSKKFLLWGNAAHPLAEELCG